MYAAFTFSWWSMRHCSVEFLRYVPLHAGGYVLKLSSSPELCKFRFYLYETEKINLLKQHEKFTKCTPDLFFNQLTYIKKKTFHEIYFYEGPLQNVVLTTLDVLMCLLFVWLKYLWAAGSMESHNFWAFLPVFARHASFLSFYCCAASDLLHLTSDHCGSCVPVNIRTTLRRNIVTKRRGERRFVKG